MAHKKKVLIDPVSLGLPCTGADSHAHLVSSRIWEERDAIIERAQAAGVKYIGEIFLRRRSYQEQGPYFADKDNIFFIYGLHPTELLKIEDDEFEAIRQDIIEDQAKSKKVKAIGEVGLDYYWKDVPVDMQKEYFVKLIQMAKELQLPLVIHCRDAFEDTYQILLEQGISGYPLLWHCFDGNSYMAKEIISHGWNISIPGNITYKKGSEETRAALHHIPLDRLHFETDCPYLTPEPWRGKTNEPAFTVFTAECVAKELGLDTESLWTQCGNNTKRFFGLD